MRDADFPLILSLFFFIKTLPGNNVWFAREAPANTGLWQITSSYFKIVQAGTIIMLQPEYLYLMK